MYSASEFLKHYENVNPLPTNLAFYDVWADDARELWDIQIGKENGQGHLDAILSFRRTLIDSSSASSSSSSSSSSTSSSVSKKQDDSWKWLITAKQVEQRTQEWYMETKNIITASEIAAIWKGPRTRAALVMSKVGEAAEISVKRNSAFPRSQTGPMDWGVRYEPVVKQILEETLGAKIQELGRIRHRKDPRVAASPDGLITECKNQELVGSLVEIKCPPTRVINDKIPFDYWCQMQLQMEVCDRPSCEFVEVKFKELDADAVPTNPLHGWITLEGNQDSMDMRYVYSGYPSGKEKEKEQKEKEQEETKEDGWVEVETYQWEVVQLRRVTLQRDLVWFQASQTDLQAFWKDVAGARQGTWSPPPKKLSKNKNKKDLAKANQNDTNSDKLGCAIVNSDSDHDNVHTIPSYTGSSDSLRIFVPATTADNES